MEEIQKFWKDKLVSSPKRSAFGHARTLEDTYEWIKPKIAKIPITRIYDITPLDRLGVPIWGAVTPLACDLTVHAGKGVTHEAARLSAIMEGIERSCAERVSRGSTFEASFNQLCKETPNEVIDPICFGLPFDSPYHPSVPISWVSGYDLLQKKGVFVPVDLVITPSKGEISTRVETNGLASGNTYVEAIVHALFEVLERDAVSHDFFFDLYGDKDLEASSSSLIMIDLRTLPPSLSNLVEALQQQGLEITLQRLTTTGNIYAFSAVIWDSDFPLDPSYPFSFSGYGCDLSPTNAAMRALIEACQSHSVTFLGARDDFEGRVAVTDRPFRLYRELARRYPAQNFPFKVSDKDSKDILEDLKELLGKLSKSGFGSCIVVDLTDPDLDVPVVRILVPGLSHPYGYTTQRPTVKLLMDLV